MLMKVNEAKQSILKALKKFKAQKLRYWSTTDGALHQEFVLPSGTKLFLRTIPHFDGESSEVEWKWILN